MSSTVNFYCQTTENLTANVSSPIKDNGTTVTLTLPSQYILERIYLQGTVSGNIPIAIGTLANPELFMPYSAGITANSISNGGCRFSSPLMNGVDLDTQVYITAQANVYGIINIYAVAGSIAMING